MGAICVSARIADIAMNLTLAVANPIQIRNEFTQLFAKTGKPEAGSLMKALRLLNTDPDTGQMYENARTSLVDSVRFLFACGERLRHE